MVKLKGKLSEFFCCCETKRGLQSERCLFIELRGKPIAVVEHLEGYKVNELFVLAFS